MGGEGYRNPALRVSLGCAGMETWIDKGTKSNSKSPPGQKERLQLWVLLLGYMIYDGDREDLGGPLIRGYSVCKSICETSLYTEDALGLHCTRVSSPDCSESVTDDFVTLALAVSMVTIDYRTAK